MDNRRLGYIFFIAGVCLYSFSDAIMKYFMQIYGVNQVTCLRTIFRFVPLLIFAFYRKENPLRTAKVTANILRAILASAGTYTAMLALKYSPMTDVVVVGYSTALFVIPFSVLILKEKIYMRDIIAIAVGFLGILLAFRPFGDVFHLGIMFAVAGAVMAALNQVIIKKLSATESELTIIFYHHMILIPISFLIGFDFFIQLTLFHFCILFLGGIIGAVAQYSITHAFKLSTSSSLASAAYTMLIPVTLIDFFMDGKVPDLFIIGGLILIASGSCHILRTRKMRSRDL